SPKPFGTEGDRSIPRQSWFPPVFTRFQRYSILKQYEPLYGIELVRLFLKLDKSYFLYLLE
ncbi:MAG: hypothetical protein KAR20_05250, partial [Candidatus Heimdallarchaeota archaeon]|nr:hypothetical protein [Candidatus Heimdallarchaeota archaeon]